MYNKQQYKNVRHQATRRAQRWLKKLRHLEAIQVLFVSVAIESPVVKNEWFCFFYSGSTILFGDLLTTILTRKFG